MNGREYVSLSIKKLPALLGERVTSSYLANNIARFIATLATWVRNSAQNCQLLVFRPDLLLVALMGNTFPYSPYLSPPRLGDLWKRLTYSLPFIAYFIIARSV